MMWPMLWPVQRKSTGAISREYMKVSELKLYYVFNWIRIFEPTSLDTFEWTHIVSCTKAPQKQHTTITI